jgi:hypothetical protein
MANSIWQLKNKTIIQMKIKSYCTKNFSIIFLLIIVFTLCCKSLSSPKLNFVELPEIMEPLEGKTIILQNSMFNPLAMTILDDKLFVFDDVKEDIIKAFSLPEIEFAFSYGNVGRGPNEFLKIDNNYFMAYSNQIELLDFGVLKRLKIIDDRMETFEAISLPRLKNPINRIQKLNDTIYVADNAMDENQEHILIDIGKNEIIKEFGDYPNDNLNVKDNIEKYQIYAKFVVSNVKQNKFAVFYQSFPILRIYNKFGELQKNIYIKDDNSIEYFAENRDQNLIYFSFPYAAENFIYVMRVNKTEVQIMEDLNNLKPEILVWNWDGNLVARYRLDKIISRFAVSEKYKTLYGTFMMKGNEIYEFDLPFLQ